RTRHLDGYDRLGRAWEGVRLLHAAARVDGRGNDMAGGLTMRGGTLPESHNTRSILLVSNLRAGIEWKIFQGGRACGLRRSRYIGKAKAYLRHFATATAMNVSRITDCLADQPRETTTTSAFTRLMAAVDAA